MEAQEQPRPGGRGGGGGGDYFRTMYSRDRDAVASIRRSGLKVGTEFQKWRRRGERKIGRESSGLETDFRVCRAAWRKSVRETLVYYRAPTKETLPRTTPEDSSSHRISLVQELGGKKVWTFLRTIFL